MLLGTLIVYAILFSGIFDFLNKLQFNLAVT